MTPFIKKKEIKKDWYLINAENAAVGRLAAFISKVLRGKNKPTFNPHIDNGDFVVVTNIDKIKFSGKKFKEKKYFKHTGYPGGQKRISPKELFDRDQTSLVRQAIKGMLPKNKLGRAIYGNLHVYAGTDHKHEAQQPKEVKINL